MSTDELNDLENNLFAISYRIKSFIDNLVEKYRMDRFSILTEKGVIKENMYYEFPSEIKILDYTENINKEKR